MAILEGYSIALRNRIRKKRGMNSHYNNYVAGTDVTRSRYGKDFEGERKKKGGSKIRRLREKE